jgi:membrane protein insertase Oxa1/YidC/SpoIIIJ
MGALIASSSALFLATTGFNYSDLVSWVGGILETILGGGLGLVNATIGWIIAIIIITVIVRLLYHGLRWLHIVR